jgi:hypothetical protein
MQDSSFDLELMHAEATMYDCALCGSTDRAYIGCYKPTEAWAAFMRPREWPPDTPLSFLYAICRTCERQGPEAVAAKVEEKLIGIACELRAEDQESGAL